MYVFTKSDSPNATILSAERAHAAMITMLAVGVGSQLDRRELLAIASPPKCTNQFFPRSFNDMMGVVSSIQKKVCEGKVLPEILLCLP